MKLSFSLIVVLISIALLFTSCKKDDNPADSNAESSTLKISHSGVDWSEGAVGSQGNELDYNFVDGETIAWCPNGNGGGWETGIWYRSNAGGIYKMGNGNLNDYSEVDTTLYDDDVCDNSLTAGEVWAAKCLDGYVIFKVKKQPDVAQSDWECEVDYKFSTTKDF